MVRTFSVHFGGIYLESLASVAFTFGSWRIGSELVRLVVYLG